MLFTASRRSILQACAYPFRSDVAAPEMDVGEGAKLGTYLHACIEMAIAAADPPPCPDDVDGQAALDMLDMWRAWFDVWCAERSEVPSHSEIALAYNPTTGVARLPRSSGHRDYSDLREGEVAGTIDYLRIEQNGRRLVLVDWKSSRTLIDVGDASPQLRTLALFAARWFGASEVHALAVYISPHRVEVRDFTMDAFALDAEQHALAGELALANEHAGPLTGPHCRWCPARLVCPAHSRETSPAESSALAALSAPGELSEAQVARAHVALKVISDRVEMAKKRVRQEVERLGAVDLGDGRVLRLAEATRETLTKASIVRALGKDDAAALIDRLRDCGAMQETTYQRLTESKL